MATKMDKAKAQIVLDHPFFASILLRRKMVETRSIPTLAVDGKATIYYNPDFTEKLTVPQLVWGLCHEVGHVIGQHANRVGSRNRKKWNYAGDAWINDTLDDSKIGQRIPNCVDMAGSKDLTVETIYDNLPDDGGGGGGGDGDDSGSGSGDPSDGIGDDIIEGDGGRPMTQDEIREIDGEIKVQIAEAAQAAKMRGQLSSTLAGIVADILNVKTPWYEILEKHCVSRVNQGQTWRRPNRRFEDVYLPSVDKLPQMGELVVQVDVSGSISKQELDHYAGHLSRIAEQCRPEKVHVLYTDTEVKRHVEFECGEEVTLEFFSGGGTHMPAGFDYCDEQGINPDVFVCLTDGYTDFGEAQNYPIVWCISSDIEAPHGENIHFEMT
jgi:predicted metal-dependent peptidase